MSNRIVFRLESKTLSYKDAEVQGRFDESHWALGDSVNIGYYRTPNLVLKGETHYNKDLHPAPDCDRILQKYFHLFDCDTSYVFGFKSLDDLRRWFNDPIHLAANNEVLRIGVYSVPSYSVVDGQFQTIFKAEDAKLIEVLPANYNF